MNFDTSVYSYKDYVSFLKDVFVDISKYEVSYTQDDFARNIGMSAPRVSQIFKRKEGISTKRAVEIAKNLELSEKEAEYFIHLVSYRTSKSEHKKNVSAGFIKENYRETPANYQVLENWSLLELPGYEIIWNLIDIDSDFSDLSKISRMTGLDQSDIERVITKLLELKLVERQYGKLKRLSNHPAYGNSMSSDVIKNYHRNKLMDSLRSLDTQDTDTRVNESLTFTMKRSDFQKLSQKIEKFVDGFLSDLEEGGEDEIATLNVSFFSNLSDKRLQ